MQASTVHGSASSQSPGFMMHAGAPLSGGEPASGMHTRYEWTHPEGRCPGASGSHRSVLQESPSSQNRSSGRNMQRAARKTSIVQSKPSSQRVVPASPGPASQLVGPRHIDMLQVSGPVQALPSSQPSPSVVREQGEELE